MLSDKDQRCTDRKRAITPAVVQRQRVPFDWTVRLTQISAMTSLWLSVSQRCVGNMSSARRWERARDVARRRGR